MLVTLLAGCGVFPSDPSVPPLALRVDGGVISVLIPHCGDEKVVAAAVYDAASGSPDPAVWSATGYTSEGGAEVRLDAASWRVSSGSYEDVHDVAIDVQTDGIRYGGSATSVDLDAARDLPDGIFFLNGAKVDAAGYQSAMTHFPCRSPIRTSP